MKKKQSCHFGVPFQHFADFVSVRSCVCGLVVVRKNRAGNYDDPGSYTTKTRYIKTTFTSSLTCVMKN